MIRVFILFAALGLVSACGDGQPFFNEDEPPADSGGGGIGGDRILPPGTNEPSPDSGILRFEALDNNGGGLVTDVAYDAASDTFRVDNLGFDGANVYQRGVAVSSLGEYAVYQANAQQPDSVTGTPIGQIIPYRAILGVSRNSVDGEARTSFAIVRTGGYVEYGYGGYIYERQGGVVLPTTGQAVFSGDYAGIRVFDGRGGLEYTAADMTMSIDFEDFNRNQAVRGTISNRTVTDSNGNTINILLPDLVLTTQEGTTTIDRNGEIAGTLAIDQGLAVQSGDAGTYSAALAGDLTRASDGGEVVGIAVIVSSEANGGDRVLESGGFILYR